MSQIHVYFGNIVHQKVLGFYQYLLLPVKCVLSKCPRLKHGFWLAICLA